MKNTKRLRRPGIYIICSTRDDRCYVGSAANIYLRWKEHRCRLRLGIHENPRLQNFYRKYGPQSLEFRVVEFCEKSELVVREQFHLDRFDPAFNIYRTARSPQGTKRTQATRKRISEALTGRIFSEEHRKNISKACKGRQAPNKGKSMSAEQRAKLSVIASKRRLSSETRRRISESLKGRPSPTKGTVLSEEHKEKLRKASTGRKHTEEAKEKIRQANTGREFSEEHRKKISLAHCGRVLTEEHKRKLSEAGKKSWASGQHAGHSASMVAYHRKKKHGNNKSKCN